MAGVIVRMCVICDLETQQLPFIPSLLYEFAILDQKNRFLIKINTKIYCFQLASLMETDHYNRQDPGFQNSGLWLKTHFLTNTQE